LYQKTTLDNGLRLITATMPHTRSVAIGFFIGAGSRYEAEAHAGISHFIEHLCFKGTSKRPTAREISTVIEGVGGILNGGTDKELTVYWCKVGQPHFHLALDVLVDMLLNSRFDPVEIEKERQVIIEEIHMSTVSTISRDMLLGYLASQYQPSNTVVTIAGDIQHQEAVTTVKQIPGNWATQQPHPGYLAYKEKPVRRLRIENRDTEQVHLCLALPGLPLLHPKRFTLGLLNVILGEGMSSRLFTEIRDKLGLAYSIGSYVDHFSDTGSIIISAGVELKNLQVATKAILEQLSQLKETVPESELVKAKEFSKGRLLLRMEDSRSVVGWMGGQEILTRRILSVDEVMSIIDAITTEELQRLARELLVGNQLRLAVVGPVQPDEPLEELLKL